MKRMIDQAQLFDWFEMPTRVSRINRRQHQVSDVANVTLWLSWP